MHHDNRLPAHGNQAGKILVPSSIWDGRPDYSAPMEEVHKCMATYLFHTYTADPLFRTILHPKGVRTDDTGRLAWSRWEAEMRLRKLKRERMTLRDHEELVLREMVQHHGRASTYLREVADYLKNRPSLAPLLCNLMRAKGYQPHVPMKILAEGYDLMPIPYRYWRAAAIAKHLAATIEVNQILGYTTHSAAIGGTWSGNG